MSADLDTAAETVPAGTRRRFRWALPVLLLVIWMMIGGIGGPYAGKLAQVQKNDASAFLPASAESQRVSQLQKKFTAVLSFPAFVLVESDSVLSPETLAKVDTFAQQLPDLTIPVKGSATRKVSDFIVPGPIPVIRSQDGKAALLLVNFDIEDIGITLADGESPIQRSVEVIRDQEPTLTSAGVKAYVAGPGGQLADLVKAFSGIDGVLVLAALLAVFLILLLVYRSPVIPFLVIFSAVFALSLASAVVYFLAKNDVITLDGKKSLLL